MFDKIRRRGFALDPSCELWMPVYRYGLEQTKWWDYSGHNRHGTIVGAVPGYPPSDPVANGSFTTAGVPFAIWTSSGGGTSTINRDTSVYVTSPASCRFDLDASGSAAYTYQGPSLLPNKRYRISFRYKNSAGKSCGYLITDVSTTVKLDATGQWVPYGTGTYLNLPDATDWTSFSLEFIGNPSYSDYYVIIGSNPTAVGQASAQLWFDDVSITLLDTLINPRWNFDGVDDRVVHTAINLGKLHTLHYWIERIGEVSGMVHAGAVDYNGLRISDTTVGYSSGVGTAVTVLHNGAALTTKKTLISVIRILDKVTFYQDGVQIGVEQTMGGQPDDLTLTDIGRFSDGTSYFKGIIHEATVFNDNKGFIGVRNYFEMTRAIQGI